MEDFEQILADKQHRELIVSLRQVVAAMKPNENLAEVVRRAIEHSDRAMDNLIRGLSEMKPAESNVILNQDAVIQQLINLSSEMKSSFEIVEKAIESRPTEWNFTVKRNFNNLITEVNAKIIK